MGIKKVSVHGLTMYSTDTNLYELARDVNHTSHTQGSMVSSHDIGLTSEQRIPGYLLSTEPFFVLHFRRQGVTCALCLLW